MSRITDWFNGTQSYDRSTCESPSSQKSYDSRDSNDGDASPASYEDPLFGPRSSEPRNTACILKFDSLWDLQEIDSQLRAAKKTIETAGAYPHYVSDTFSQVFDISFAMLKYLSDRSTSVNVAATKKVSFGLAPDVNEDSKILCEYITQKAKEDSDPLGPALYQSSMKLMETKSEALMKRITELDRELIATNTSGDVTQSSTQATKLEAFTIVKGWVDKKLQKMRIYAAAAERRLNAQHNSYSNFSAHTTTIPFSSSNLSAPKDDPFVNQNTQSQYKVPSFYDQFNAHQREWFNASAVTRSKPTSNLYASNLYASNSYTYNAAVNQSYINSRPGSSIMHGFPPPPKEPFIAGTIYPGSILDANFKKEVRASVAKGG